MARPNEFKKKVEPYLDEISEMALTMTESQIANNLGISLSTWKRYKKQYEPLRTALKKGRKDLVKELKSTLIKKAKGFYYKEVKEVNSEKDGLTVVTHKKYAQPDVASINLLLKNYDTDNWSNDPQSLRLKEKELELKEKKIESEDW